MTINRVTFTALMLKFPPALRAGSILLLLLLTAVHGRADVFPRAVDVTSLCVITTNALQSPAEAVLVATLQGNVARRSAEQIYIEGSGGYPIWKNYLRDACGIPFTNVSDAFALLRRFRNHVSGYVLFDRQTNRNSINVATSLCGLFNAVAVDVSIEDRVRDAGLTNLIADVRMRDELWAWTNHNGLFNRSVVIEQREGFAGALRDYAVLANAFTFFDGNSAFRNLIMESLNPDSVCLGWGDPSPGEHAFIMPGSRRGVFMIAADWALNLSTLSGVRAKSIEHQPRHVPSTESNVHYVTFVATDGDNVQWLLGDFPNYFNHPARTRFTMGWTISPALADLAMPVLRWFHEKSPDRGHAGSFVAGPSGVGYFYPSMYPDLSAHARKLNDLMDRCDLKVVQVIDFGAFTNRALWNEYLDQPSIDALLYIEYSPYHGAHGAIDFSSSGKPIIAARDLLWAALGEPREVAERINSHPRNPRVAAAYTFVPVHVWSKSPGDVHSVVTNLSPHVRVVSPEAFARLVRDNVGRRLEFDFSDGSQDWAAAVPGDTVDAWDTRREALQLKAGAAVSRRMILPIDSTDLMFDLLAESDSMNGLIRVRIEGLSGTSVIEARPETDSVMRRRRIELGKHAGETVTVHFERTGSGTVFIDNIVVRGDGEPSFRQ